MISIFCRGEYYYKQDSNKGRKTFEQTIKAPSLDFFKQTSVRYMGTDDDGKIKTRIDEFVNVRGIIKKKLLPMLLKPKYQDFVRVRIVIIDEIVDSDGKSLDLPITLQSRNQLISFCKQNKIPLVAENYLDIDELRSDILEYKNDPVMFRENYARRSKKREEEKAFMEMNGLLEDDGKIVTAEKVTPPSSPKPRKAEPVGIGDL